MDQLEIIQPQQSFEDLERLAFKNQDIRNMKSTEIQAINIQNYKNKTLDSLCPVVIWIEPTALCNLKCIMCPHEGDGLTRKKGLMELDLFKKIIDEVKEWKPVIKLFHTGESLIHPKLREMIIYTREAGCFTMLNTNATFLDRKKSEMLFESGLDYLSFSFDGATKEVYEKIRIGGDFDKTLSNIIQFLKLKKELGRKRPFVNLEMIRMKDTEEEVEAFKDKFKDFPVDNIGIKKFHNFGGQIDVEGESGRVYSDLSCIHPWSFASILWDGSVVPCCRDAHGKHVFGNVNENKLMDIWNKHYKMLKFRETLAEEGGYKKIDICSNCSEVFEDRVNTKDVKMLG